jgi:hypothetical protein
MFAFHSPLSDVNISLSLDECMACLRIKFYGDKICNRILIVKPHTVPSRQALKRRSSNVSPQFCIGIYHIIPFFSNGPTAPGGPEPPQYRDFTITLRHTTLGTTPLDEWSVRRRDLYLTTHNTLKRQTSMLRRDSNPQSQHAKGRRPTP